MPKNKKPDSSSHKKQNQPASDNSDESAPSVIKKQPTKRKASSAASKKKIDKDSDSEDHSETNIEELNSDDSIQKPKKKRVKKNPIPTEKLNESPKSNENSDENPELALKPKRPKVWTKKSLSTEENLALSSEKNPPKPKASKSNSATKNQVVSSNEPIVNDSNYDFGSLEATESNINDIWVPDFILEENIRDKNLRKKDDPDYDPTTVYFTPDDLQSLTPMMQQYWQVKAENYDKIVIIKLGRMYQIFGRDAFFVNKIIDLPLYAWGKSTFLFFGETFINKYAPKIMEAGYKIVIMEQMGEHKTTKTGKSNKSNKSSKAEEILPREVCQVLTVGTSIEFNPEAYQSKFLLAIFEWNLTFGIVYLDTTTHDFHIGEFVDDVHRSHLRTLLYRIKPLEVIYYKEFITKATLSQIQSLSTKPQLSLVKNGTKVALEEVFSKMDQHFKDRKESDVKGYPELLKTMRLHTEESAANIKDKSKDENFITWFHTFQALYMCIVYMEDVFLAETVVTMGNYLSFDLMADKNSSLYLDSQTLQNLEILEVNYAMNVGEDGSLKGFMDRTRTAFGKRLFKRWITAPLMDTQLIKERTEAVEDLMKNMDILDFFQDSIGKLSDIERQVNKIYNLSNRKRMSAAYFEDFAMNRLHEFLAFLKELKKVEGFVEYFQDYLPKFKSKRLRQLTSFKEVDLDAYKFKKKSSSKGTFEGVFPRINKIIADFENMVIIEDKIPIPAPGVCKESDDLREKINECKGKFNGVLEACRKRFGDFKNINFAHSKSRYELEIPEDYVLKKKPEGWTMTTKRKGFQRFHNPEIEDLLAELQKLEAEYKKVLVPFIIEYFKKFYERNLFWKQVVSCLAEIDCLCGLAKLASSMDIRCKPKFVESEDPVFDLRDMVHPCVAKRMKNFVPNDMVLQNGEEIFLVTGPNMGGKSTLLRQTCVAVIMAQMGSFVPAQSFTLTPMDRIFSRIGASDRLGEGKSTFYVEMEETLSIVNEATRRSLVIIDELGRGTSTYDGVSIAYAVLKYIAEEVRCMTLFATHYHLLIDEFKLYENIDNYHMKCVFDQERDEVKFLYKFSKGQASNSYGIVVAKMAGLPKAVIEEAKVKAEFMNNEKRNITYEKNIVAKYNKAIEFLSRVESVEEIEESWLNEELHALAELC